MRKFLPFLFAAALASSCIDNAYDLSNVNTDDVTIGDEDSEYRLPLATVYVSMSELKEGGADIKTLFDEADIWLPSPLPGNAAYVDLRELQNNPDTITPLLQALIDQMMDDDAKIAAVAACWRKNTSRPSCPCSPRTRIRQISNRSSSRRSAICRCCTTGFRTKSNPWPATT